MTSLSSIVQPMDKTFSGSDHPLLLHNNSCIWIISGRRGAGKSTLALSVLGSKKAWKNRFENIFFISSTGANDKKFKALVDELREDGKFYDHFDEDAIEEIFQKVQQTNEEAREEGRRKMPKSLLLLDDVILDLPRSKSSLLNRLIVTSRHLNLSICLITQKYNLSSTLFRSNADLISFFPSLNRKEVETLQSDLNIDPHKFQQLYNTATDSANSFLHCNLTAFPPVFYKKFDRLEIDLFS